MPFIIVNETKDKDGNVIQTAYFKGYRILSNDATNGPMFGYDLVHAQKFDKQENANNLIGGDPRFSGCVVRAM